MAKALATTFIGAIFCVLTLGNSRQLVRGLGNRNPYQVIFHSTSGETQEKPGLYTLGLGGVPKLLAHGKVLGANPTFSGVLATLQIGSVSDRDEAIAVVDGDIYLFSSASKSTSADSLIVLGKGKNRVLDVLTRQQITLPSVASLEDITVFTRSNRASGVRHGELVLISLRHPSPIGNGITIAFVIGPSEGSVLPVLGTPVVLDYSFLSKKELSSIEVVGSTEGFRVASQLILKNHATPHKGDFALIQKWRHSVSRYSKLVQLSKKDAATVREIEDLRPWMPIYSLIDGSIEMEQSPSDLLLEEPLALRQFFNPLNGSAVISSGVNATDEKAVGIQGTLDFDDEGKLISIPYSDDLENSHSAVLVSRAGRLWAVLPMRGDIDRAEMIDLGFDHPENARVSFVHHFSAPGDHYILTSARNTGESGSTQCTLVQELSAKLVVTKRLPLVPKYIPPKELKNRLLVQTDEKTGKETLLFDTVTPVSSNTRYDSRKKRTTPFLSLTDSLERQVVQVYAETLQDRQITEDIAFRAYDPKGAIDIRTGLYVSLGSGFESFFAGQLLRNGRKRLILDSESVAATTANPTASVRLLAVSADPSGRSEKEFKILGIAKAQGENFSGNIFQVEVPAPFSSFRGAKIVFGRRQNSLEMTILAFIDPPPPKKGQARSASKGAGGVYSQHFKLEYAYQSQPRRLVVHAISSGYWLEKTAIPLSTMKDRLVPDPAGSWYWIVDPSIDNKSTQFSVRALSSPEVKIFPRKTGVQKRLKWEESLETDWGKHLGGSDWLIYGQYTLGNLHPNIATILKGTETNAETECASTLPGLDDFLDSMAALKGPSGPTVLLVDPKMKDRIIEQMLLRLATNRTGPWAFSSRRFDHFNFHEILDPECTREHLAEEAEKIAADSAPNRRNLLFTDILRLLPKDAKALVSLKKRNAIKDKAGDENETEDDNEAEEEEPAEDEENSKSENGSDPKKNGAAEDGDDSDESEILAEDDADQGGDEPRKVRGSPFLLLLTGGKDIPVSKLGRPELTKHFPSLVVATPEEWRIAQEYYPKEAPVFERFAIASNILSSSWTLWGPESSFAKKSTKALNRAPTSKEEHEVFPNIEQLLVEMVDRSKPTRHRILLVPDEIKGLVERLILTRWASDSRALAGPWSHTNQELALFQITKTVPGAKEGETREIKQEDLLDNFDSMRAIASQRRPVLIGRMDELTRIGRPTAVDAESSFAIRDYAQKGQGSSLEGDGNSDRSRIPHALWWLRTEGHRIQPRTLERTPPPQVISSLLIGSERDWAILNGETEWESRFGLANDFEIIRLETPTVEKRRELIQNLFNRSEITRLGYRFQLEQIDGIEAQRQIVSLVVHRAGQIARQHQFDDTAAFIRVYAELSRALTQDTRLRTERCIDRFFVESLFSRIFPVPIALNSLPPDDFLHRLKYPVQAGVALQSMGYNSPIDLKIRVINTILGQTHGSTPGRPIPSSTILFGGTSTGKTFLFETLMKYLGLKAYDCDLTDNDEADYYIVKVRNLREKEDPGAPESRGVDTEIEHIVNFLAGPKGHRGFILFDDIHLAKSTDIYRKLMAFIESIFEAKDGYITVKKKGHDERREIPVRNINLFLTINPKRDKDIRDRYDAGSDLTGEILAALARSDYAVEDSFLARFTTIIDMSQFPSEAKAPALVSQLRKAQEDDYRSDPRIVIVGPDLLAKVVNGNKDANAREFLTSATRSIIHLDGDLPEAALYIATSSESPSGEGEMDFDTKTERVEAFVRSHRVLKPVGPKDFSNRLEWIRHNLDAFRLHAALALLGGTRRDPRLSADPTMRKSLLIPLFLTAIEYFQSRPHLPISLVQIHAEDFGGLESGERDYILRLIDQLAKNEANFFPFAFGPKHGMTLPRLGDFVRGSSTAARRHSRVDVLSETSRAIYEILTPMVESFYRVPSLGRLPESAAWFNSLPKTDSKEMVIEAGDKLNSLFQKLGGKLFDPNLAETLENRPPLTAFDQAIFFLLSLDRAILDFPWARMNHYLTERVVEASRDPSLGQAEEFQAFLFKNKLTPFNPITVDSIAQTFDSLNEKRSGGSTDDPKIDVSRSCAELVASGVVNAK